VHDILLFEKLKPERTNACKYCSLVNLNCHLALKISITMQYPYLKLPMAMLPVVVSHKRERAVHHVHIDSQPIEGATQLTAAGLD
jgi:hypothetical protein